MPHTQPLQGPYEVEWIRNVRIPMPDGIALAADLYVPQTAPASGDRFPAIIEYTPYHKNNNAAYGPRASRYPYFASHGYVFVNVDIRGLGDSEGCNTSPTSPEEVQDNLEVIRWCARQPWCDGSVGMIGISYTAGVCYDAARFAPEALKAIIVCQMCSDWYDGMACPGGSPRPFAYENYAPLMAAYNLAPPDPELVGPEWEAIWGQRLEGSRPWGLAYLENLRDGPFWESRLLRGHEEQVRAATFLIGGWCDWYPDDMLRVYGRLQCPKRVLIGPWTHNYPENGWPLPRINDRFECLRWFDKHLKGIDTDPERPLEAELPVSLFVREHAAPDLLRREDPGYFRHEAQWPPAHVQALALPLSGSQAQALTLAYRTDVGVAAGRYAIGQMLPGWGMPDDQRLDEPFSVVVTSEPQLAALELLGAPEAHLSVSCTAEIALISVKLCDVAPDGTSVMITKGILNLSHRESYVQPEPLAPGAVYRVRVPLLATAYRVAAGHRLRVMIAAADFQNSWPTPTAHELTFYSTPEEPFELLLPVSGEARSDPTAPEFRASDFPPLPPDQIPTPEYRIERDLVQRTTTVVYSTRSGVGINDSRYIVSLDRPAEASIESSFEYPLDRPGVSVRVRSRCVTESDAAEFRHTVHVEITLNGELYWERTWVASVARETC
jgi:predicted acyl esterase